MLDRQDELQTSCTGGTVVHLFVAGLRESCPRCGAISEVYSRVVGYLRPVISQPLRFPRTQHAAFPVARNMG
ncbi:MAG: hypothetical protein A2177_01310 [Spirochaetes bacterium RBG_13_68_11]|nr:MAG: hypothetical protein A2177_01310 [Spirochaetes bacterium RBG_13_68_11]